MPDPLKLIVLLGPLGLLVWVLFFVVTQPEKTEQLRGQLLGLFAWVSGGIRHRASQASIQGRVSVFAKSVDKEVPGTMPYNLKLRFVTGEEGAELEVEKETVIVRLRDTGQEDVNLVNALIQFCPKGVIPQSRRFLGKEMNRAVDVTVLRRLLVSIRHHSALDYLDGSVLPEMYGAVEGLKDFCQLLGVLNERGLFTRVVLAELRELGFTVGTQEPGPEHYEEVSAFVQYVYGVAVRGPRERLPQRWFKGRHLSVAFIFVGTPEVMNDRGADPYLNFLRVIKRNGIAKGYLAARGARRGDSSFSIDMAKLVAERAESLGLAQTGRSMHYLASDNEGVLRPHCLEELTLTESEPQPAPRSPSRPRRQRARPGGA